MRQQLLAHLTAKYDPAAERGPLTQFRQNILHWVDNELPEALSRLAGTYHREVQKVPEVPEIQLVSSFYSQRKRAGLRIGNDADAS